MCLGEEGKEAKGHKGGSVGWAFGWAGTGWLGLRCLADKDKGKEGHKDRGRASAGQAQHTHTCYYGKAHFDFFTLAPARLD